MSTLPNVTVTAAAASRLCCELSVVKTELGITGSGSDTQLTRTILAVSLYFAGPEGLGRSPWLQTYSEKTRGLGGHYLWLSNWPIQSVTSVTEGTGDSPTSVASSTYSIADESRDRLYRVDGWSHHSFAGTELYTATTGALPAYNVAYVAGWVMPDQLTAWAATTAVTSGAWWKATDVDEPFIFQAGGSGTSGSTEPTWPTVSGGTVVDNDVTWTAYDQRLPQDLEEAAIIQTMDWFRGGLQIPTGIRAESFGDMRIQYATVNSAIGVSPTAVSPAVKTILARYR